jgi:hypothetical protein
MTDLLDECTAEDSVIIPVEPIDAGAPVGAAVPCVYCRRPVPANIFAYWSRARRLVSATCPSCLRRVTLTTSTWQRWSGTPTQCVP